MSKLIGRYDTQGMTEGEFEPGSRGRILKNLLGIRAKREIEAEESEAYDTLLYKTIELYGKGHKFTAKDICQIHNMWLSNIYIWAGKYRNVNMSKGGFQFANALLVPKLMTQFEKEILHKYTPCRFLTLDEIAESIAVVHVEFILVHPFREGNGRLGRLLSALMALQADLPLLNFEAIKGRYRQEYILAVQAGLDRNYEPMKKIFRHVIERTIKLYRE